jgi:hypothetical protein
VGTYLSASSVRTSMMRSAKRIADGRCGTISTKRPTLTWRIAARTRCSVGASRCAVGSSSRIRSAPRSARRKQRASAMRCRSPAERSAPFCAMRLCGSYREDLPRRIPCSDGEHRKRRIGLGVPEGLRRSHLHRLYLGHHLALRVAGDRRADACGQRHEQPEPQRRAHHLDVLALLVNTAQMSVSSACPDLAL